MKILNEVGLDGLKKEDGFTLFVEKMNEAFKPGAQNKVYSLLCDFFVNLNNMGNENIRLHK